MKNFPKKLDSKTSYLRIEVPENLDLALEGLIRKVLREKPKTDDIYSFAAEYFENLIKIRDQANIKCTSRMPSSINNEEALQMIQLANTFKKPGSGKLPKKLNGSNKTTHKTSNKELALKNIPAKSKNRIRQTQKNQNLKEEKQNTGLVSKAKDKNFIAEEKENIQFNDKLPKRLEDSKKKNIKEAQLKSEELLKLVKEDEDKKETENVESNENKEKTQTNLEQEVCTLDKEETPLDINNSEKNILKAEEQSDNTTGNKTVDEGNENGKEIIEKKVEEDNISNEVNRFVSNKTAEEKQNVVNQDNHSNNVNNQEKASTTENKVINDKKEEREEVTRNIEPQVYKNEENVLLDMKNKSIESKILNTDNKNHEQKEEQFVKPEHISEVNSVEEKQDNLLNEKSIQNENDEIQEKGMLKISTVNENTELIGSKEEGEENQKNITNTVKKDDENEGGIHDKEKESEKLEKKIQEDITNNEEIDDNEMGKARMVENITKEEENKDKSGTENQMDVTNNEEKLDESKMGKGTMVQSETEEKKEEDPSGIENQIDVTNKEEKLDENEMGKAKMEENIIKEETKEDTSGTENQTDNINNQEKLDENEMGKAKMVENITKEEKEKDTSSTENQTDITNNEEKIDENETGKAQKVENITKEEKEEGTSGTENQTDITDNEEKLDENKIDAENMKTKNIKEKEENNLENKVDDKMLIAEKENKEICEESKLNEENKEEKKLVEEENEKNKQDPHIEAENLKPQLSALLTERTISQTEKDNSSELESGKVNTIDSNQNSETSNLEVNEVQQNSIFIKDDDATLEEATEKENSEKSVEMEEKENKKRQISDEKDKEIPEDKKPDVGLTNENMSTATSEAEDKEKNEKDKVEDVIEESCADRKAENDLDNAVNDVSIEIDENKKSFFKTLTHSLKEPDDDKVEPQENLKNEVAATEEDANAKIQAELVVETEETVKNNDTIETHESCNKEENSEEKLNAKLTETSCNSQKDAEGTDNIEGNEKSIEDELCVVVDALGFVKPDENKAEESKGEDNNSEPQQTAERKVKTIETHYYDLLKVPEMVTKEYIIHHTKDEELPKATESEISEPIAEVRTSENESQIKTDSEHELMSVLHFSDNLTQMNVLKANEIFLDKEKYFSSMQVNFNGAKEKKKSGEDDEGNVEEVMVKKSVTDLKAVPMQPRDSEELKEQNTENSMDSKEEKYKKGLSDDSDSNASISADGKSVDIDVPFISVDVKTAVETQLPEENKENEEKKEETPLQLPTVDVGLANETKVSTIQGKMPTKKLTRTSSQTLAGSDISNGSKRKLLTKTKSTSSIREHITDTDIWSTIEKELEDAATKIQSKFRAYSTRKRLRREDAIQITTEEPSPRVTPVEENKNGGETLSTGEFHDSIVLSVHPR